MSGMNDDRVFRGRRPSGTLLYALHSESLTSSPKVPISPTTASDPAWPRYESPPPRGAEVTRQGTSKAPHAADTRRSQLSEVAAAAERKFHHDLGRGLGPETSFSVTADDAVLVSEAAAVPCASSSHQRRPPTLGRSLSNKFKALGRAISERVPSGARANTATSRPEIRLVPGVMHDNINGGPEVSAEGFEIVHRAIPIKHAQRQREAEMAAGTRSARFDSDLAVAARAERSRVRALTNDRASPTRRNVKQVRSGQPVVRSPAVVKQAQTATPQAAAAPGATKTVGHPDRCTTLGDFIDIAPSEAGSVKSPKTVAQDKSRPMTPYRRPSSIAMTPPPVPITAAAASKRKLVRKAKPRDEQRYQLRAESSSAAQMRQAELANHSDYALTPEQQELLQRGYVGPRLRPRAQMRMPEYAEDGFDVTLNDDMEEQLHAQGVDVDRYLRALSQAKIRCALDAPCDDLDSEPVIEQRVHDNHNSWIITRASQPDRIDAYHGRIANDGMMSIPRQGKGAGGEDMSTADLWARIEVEKAGRAKPTLGGR